MKVLWICNLILPEVAAQMGLGTIPKEGWVKGLFDAMLRLKHSGNTDGAKELELAFAFPVGRSVIEDSSRDDEGFVTGKVELNDYPGESVEYYGFYEDTVHESVYDTTLENTFKKIFDAAKPDIAHSFGTEFPHTLAAGRVWNNPDRFLIGIQGPCTVYAERYTSHLPEKIVNRHTFRDFLKKDSIREQKEKYIKRGINEREAIKLAGHIAGRTDFDKSLANEWNAAAEYHYAGETLRQIFYTGEWSEDTAQSYRIFVSQADYPLKGFHFLLMAVGKLLAEQAQNGVGDIQIYVAGQSIVDIDSLKKKIKISSYGKYLRKLMSDYNLESRVHILGRLSAEQMKEQYLLCDTYVCCSECENSPNSLGEAMMLQVPIVTARVGGITSVFTVDEDGYSFRNEPEDSLDQVVSALAEALLERWNSPSKVVAGELDINARRYNAGKHAHKNHNPEKNAHDMFDIYCSMMH